MKKGDDRDEESHGLGEHAQFEAAMRNLPKSEVQRVVECIPPGTPVPDERHLRVQLALDRWQHPVCQKCLRKSALEKTGEAGMFKCPRCFLVWYCGQDGSSTSPCMRSDAAIHDKWCCEPDAPADTGPNHPTRIEFAGENSFAVYLGRLIGAGRWRGPPAYHGDTMAFVFPSEEAIGVCVRNHIVPEHNSLQYSVMPTSAIGSAAISGRRGAALAFATDKPGVVVMRVWVPMDQKEFGAA